MAVAAPVMDAAAIQQLIAQAIAAHVAANPPVQQVAAALVPAPPVVFAVNPAGVGNAPWDFQTSQGMKVFHAVTTPLDPRYDGTEVNLIDFLTRIWSRAKAYGFTSILTVLDSRNTPRDMTREWGCLQTEDMKRAAVIYLNQQERPHQASQMLLMLILASVDARIISRLYHRKLQYTVDIAAPGALPILKEDGPCMLFELIKMVSVETRATVGNIMRQVNNLQQLMELHRSNIELFNTAVEDLIDALNARRAPVPELLTNLFAGYLSCNDSTFVKYIKRKEEGYEDGSIELTGDVLMQMALEKYKTMVSKQQWLKKSDHELEFIAMQSELKQLKQNPSNRKKTPATPGTGNGVGNGSGKVNKNTGKYAWKGVAPKANEPKEKTVLGKDYIYCPHHGDTKWVLKTSVAGIEHKTGCRKMVEANAARGGADDGLVAAAADIDADEDGDDENI
jgi:hypothetical protein